MVDGTVDYVTDSAESVADTTVDAVEETWENTSTRSRGLEKFFEVEILLESVEDPALRESIKAESKADFLWEYAKNLNDFLDYTFSEDGTLMGYVMPPEQKAVSKGVDSIAASIPISTSDISIKGLIPTTLNPNEMTTMQKGVVGTVLAGLVYFFFIRKKKGGRGPTQPGMVAGGMMAGGMMQEGMMQEGMMPEGI